jgi:hypothetical protein
MCLCVSMAAPFSDICTGGTPWYSELLCAATQPLNCVLAEIA